MNILDKRDKLLKKFKRYFGVKQSKGVCCPMRLLGKHCRQYGYRNPDCPGHNPPSADHCSLWSRNGKPYMYVYQPYKKPSREELVEYCVHFGFDARTDMPEMSWWNPGETELIILKKRRDRG